MSFSRLLIANRGEIAVRLIRACREMGIESVAIYSDADAGALHVRLADRAERVGPAPARESYLDVDAVVAAAVCSGAQALHPGYGFLSENPGLARACIAANIVFIGPPPEAIELMGSKIAAKTLAQRVGVPVVPGYNGNEQSDAILAIEAQRIGFPLLIKASAGGGGRGMRVVHRPDDFLAALEGARREALAAFGDDTVLLERLIAHPRHVEIQVLADAHGNTVALGERECSIQRRHQKIVEECPSPALTPTLRAEMSTAAVRVTQAAGYVNAGTVEFVLDAEGNFYFLEMNTRLQVEHPVTELVTGLDLVRLQIDIAAGKPLPFNQDDVTLRGHAIEMRVYAEDPQTGLPATGRLALFEPPHSPGIRNDAGFATGDVVAVHYDPMLAKLIAYGHDRDAALARLRAALDDYAVLGVTTNLPQLRAIAAHPAFAAGATFTDFLDTNPLPELRLDRLPVEALVAAGVWDLRFMIDDLRLPEAGIIVNRQSSIVNRPWRSSLAHTPLRYRWGETIHNVVASRLPDGWSLLIDGQATSVVVRALRADEIVCSMRSEDAQERVVQCRVARDAANGDLLLTLRGVGLPLRLSYPAPLSVDSLSLGGSGSDGGSLVAPMPGTVIKLLVSEGQEVVAGQPLLVLEAMKMEHSVAAPRAGVVRHLPYTVGQLVPAGASLAEVDEREIESCGAVL